MKKESGQINKIVLCLTVLVILLLLWSGYNVYQSDVQLIYIAAFLWIFTVVVLLWYGNKWIFDALNSRISWLSHPSKRFFIQLLISCVYSLLCINGSYYLFKVQTSLTPPDLSQFVVLNVYGLLFLIPVLLVNFSVYFMQQWKLAHVQSNKLQEENLRTQLNSLRMQLDPHFLFNNLNVLSSLIEKDARTAQHFLDKFADVYRYVLEFNKEELVSLTEELGFVDAYVYLLKKRFDEQLKIDIDVPDSIADAYFIPPLAVQMLIENALKHNKLSAENPLHIEVFIENERWLTVRNSYSPRPEASVKRGKMGLENIQKRYAYLSALNLKIHQDHSFFCSKFTAAGNRRLRLHGRFNYRRRESCSRKTHQPFTGLRPRDPHCGSNALR